MIKQKSFIFDLNRCTGCGACIVACAIENGGKQDLQWREVYTFNETRHPGLPLFHLSMACNHCVSPACKKACPALAYSKEKGTGAVVHHAERCMGCTYCTWACPYDAPRYNVAKGVIEKCDFCIDRLKEGEAPACVCACPTNALRIEDMQEEIAEAASEIGRVEGFTESVIQPAIRFIGLRQRQRVPEATAPPSEETVNELFESSQRIPPKKITLKKEWALLLFTTIASLLTAWLTAMVLTPLAINRVIFLGAGVVGMGLTVIHLGKKFRAYRAVFNVWGSWLSREILFFSLFLFLAGLYLVFFPHIVLLGKVAAAVGFISLFSIDKIYIFAMNAKGYGRAVGSKQAGLFHFHSAHTLLNGLYLTGILTVNGFVFAIVGGIKLFLYLQRKWLFRQVKRKPRPLVSLLRVSLGFFVPLILLVLRPENIFVYYKYVIIGVIVGEVIDRTEYYDEMDIITPRKQMLMDLKKVLKEMVGAR